MMMMMMMMMVIMMTMTTIPDPIQHMNMELLFVRGRWLDWSADVKRLECFAVVWMCEKRQDPTFFIQFFPSYSGWKKSCTS